MKIKRLILGLFLTSCFCALGQNSSHIISKKEAEDLIKEKIQEHSYKSKADGGKKNYILSFNDSLIVIFNLTDEANYYSTFRINDIDSIMIEEKDFNVSLIIKLTKGKKESTFIDFKPMEKSIGLYEFILNKSFLLSELPEKIANAFKFLAEFRID